MEIMRLSAVIYLVAALLGIAIKETSSYPTGAPHYTCRSQVPVHVNCTQDGPAPYGIIVNKDGPKARLEATDHKKYSGRGKCVCVLSKKNGRASTHTHAHAHTHTLTHPHYDQASL